MTYMDRVLKAVADGTWQAYRISMKGEPTSVKVRMLKDYWETTDHDCDQGTSPERCNVCIRVDNYLKALCRGGQLYPGESLQTALRVDWAIDIRR